MKIELVLFLLPGLVVGLTVHEFAHAISAKWLGDRNPERMGRVSLNPFRHLSLMGTLALFFLGFGWGKPVEVNIYNFKRPRFYYLLSSLAGPASNLLIAAISLGVMYLNPPEPIAVLCLSLFYINCILAVVNLIPIPPLDGSKIWPCLIPGMKPTFSGKWMNMWMIVLMVFFFSGGIDRVLDPVLGLLAQLLPDIAQ